MFDVLTYEKGAAVVRMLEQYLGEDRFRDGIRRYLAPTSTPTPRPPTCGTPSRRPRASRPAGSWTAGSSRAATRWSAPPRRGPPGPDPGALHLPARGRAGPMGRPRPRGLGHRRRRDRQRRVLLDGDRTEIDLGGPVDGVLVNHGRLRVLPGRLPPELRTALADRALGGARAHRALPVPGRPVGGDAGRAGSRPRTCSTSSSASRTRPTSSVWQTSGRPCTGSAGWSTARPRPASPSGPPPSWPRPTPTARSPCRSRARAIGTPSSGRSCSARSARWPRTPTPGPGPPSSTGPT